MKNISYQNFAQRIGRTAEENSLPLRVMFELTYRCNFRCKHCYIPRSCKSEYAKKELSTADACRILEQLKNSGCLHLGFTGGEVLMRRDIFDILAFSKQCGFITALYTNGSFIDAKTASNLKRFGVSKVDITLPAVSEAVYREATGVSGAKDKVFNALRLLRKNKVDFSLKSCVLRSNEKEIKKIQALAKRLGVLLRLDDTLFPSWNADCKPFSLRARQPLQDRCHYEESKARRSNLLKRLLPLNRAVQGCNDTNWSSFSKVFFCGAGRAQAAITPAGELKFCLAINYPKFDILRFGFKNAWHKLNILASSVKIDGKFKCGDCRNRQSCSWCPGYSWIMTKTFTERPERICKYLV